MAFRSTKSDKEFALARQVLMVTGFLLKHMGENREKSLINRLRTAPEK